MKIMKRVVNTISHQMGIELSNIRPDSGLINDLGCDSLDLIEVIMAIEEEFEIVIDEDDYNEYEDFTITQVATTVKSLMEKE